MGFFFRTIYPYDVVNRHIPMYNSMSLSYDVSTVSLASWSKGGSRTGAPGARPLFKNIFGFVFVSLFWRHNTHLYFILVNVQCVKYVFFFLNSNYKNIGFVWRSITTIPRPQEIYLARTAPQILKFLDPPLSTFLFLSQFQECKIVTLKRVPTWHFYGKGKFILPWNSWNIISRN